ncbi:MAG: hypothetical protein WAL32_02645 [Terriglobales bacterium]
MSRAFRVRRLSTHTRSLAGRYLRWLTLGTILTWPVMFGQTAVQPGLHYRVIALPLKPRHLSNSGEVTGQTSNSRAAIWSRGHGLRLLTMPEGFTESAARGSNTSGYVVGFATGSNGVLALAYENGKLVRLSGRNSKALGVNDSGEVAGQSEIDGKPPVAPTLWKSGRVISLGGCCGGVANGINNRGQIIGDLYDQAGRYRAFLWDSIRGMQYIGPENGYSSAIAINDSGHVLLQEPERGILLWRGLESQAQIRIPDEQPADGRGLNNFDEVVGAFGPYFDADHAFLWSEKNGFRDLNDFIPANS